MPFQPNFCFPDAPKGGFGQDEDNEPDNTIGVTKVGNNYLDDEVVGKWEGRVDDPDAPGHPTPTTPGPGPPDSPPADGPTGPTTPGPGGPPPGGGGAGCFCLDRYGNCHDDKAGTLPESWCNGLVFNLPPACCKAVISFDGTLVEDAGDAGGTTDVGNIGGHGGRGVAYSPLTLDVSQYKSEKTWEEYNSGYKLVNPLFDERTTLIFANNPKNNLVYNNSTLSSLQSDFVTQDLKTIAQTKTKVGPHLPEIGLFASAVSSIKANYDLKIDKGTYWLTWFDILSRLPEGVVASLQQFTGNTLLQEISKNNHLDILIKDVPNVTSISKRTGIKSLKSGGVDVPQFISVASSLDLSPFASITPAAVAASLDPKDLAVLSSLMKVNGTPNTLDIYQGMLSKILKGQASAIDIPYLKSVTLMQTSQSIDPLTIIPPTDKITGLDFTFDYIKKYSILANGATLKNPINKAKLDMYFIPYEEVGAKVVVTSSDGTEYDLLVSNDGTISTTLGDGTLAGPRVKSGYRLAVTTSDSGDTTLPFTTELDHTYILDNVTKQNIEDYLTPVGVPAKLTTIKAEASSADGTLEFVNLQDSVLSSIYFLSANLSSIDTTLDSDFIETHKVQYDIIEGTTNAEIESLFNEEFKYAINYLGLAVDGGSKGLGADPITRYLIEDGKIILTFTTIGTNTYEDKTNKNIPIVATGIPKVLYWMTTNSTKYNPAGGQSKLTQHDSGGFKRQIDFTLSFDETLSTNGLDSKFTISDGAWPEVGVDNVIEEYAMKTSLDIDNISLVSELYK